MCGCVQEKTNHHVNISQKYRIKFFRDLYFSGKTFKIEELSRS